VSTSTPLFVLLVRHGESEANALNRFAYRTWDPGLTDRGREQAQRLVRQLAETPIVRLVSSPLRRARETLEPLAQDRGLSIEVLPALAELDMGRWDGAVLSELAQQDPQAWLAWRRDPDANPPPRGERLSGVGSRVLDGLNRLRGTEGLVVAGTHADCVKGALIRLLGVSGPASRRLFVPNTGQLLLRAMDDGTWRVVLGPLVFPIP
jgi:broad specificity phosphatase PhoE